MSLQKTFLSMSKVFLALLSKVSYVCHEWVMSYIWMSHVAHMNESCRTYEWDISYVWNFKGRSRMHRPHHTHSTHTAHTQHTHSTHTAHTHITHTSQTHRFLSTHPHLHAHTHTFALSAQTWFSRSVNVCSLVSSATLSKSPSSNFSTNSCVGCQNIKTMQGAGIEMTLERRGLFLGEPSQNHPLRIFN